MAAAFLGLAVMSTACAQAALPSGGVSAHGASHDATADSASTRPLVVMHKSPTCGCCGKWAEHMQEAGFRVETRLADDMGLIKQRAGVPVDKASCHTAEVDGYFIEGHVPAADVKRLLAERPDARGLAVPGMPIGSPGMEVPGGAVQPYVVELVSGDGGTSTFAQHGER
ncbi:DUF411 domain-containing protein [Lysobacter sp. GX 14042]|uniref:DUF411 domain-containing protein n=1 Tax=Lysobacter sp. GX 14042 TaxID=2907155 RepID=UPI001F45E41E|nr:DUF411 domain-containing protein [Lysobacter sp. GX 14042]MCE7031365.1 DUF411 domain-containing protein [Lysobacter sp. GX 14042]